MKLPAGDTQGVAFVRSTPAQREGVVRVPPPLRSWPIGQPSELEVHRIRREPPAPRVYPDLAQSLKEFVLERVNAWASKVESSSNEML